MKFRALHLGHRRSYTPELHFFFIASDWCMPIQSYDHFLRIARGLETDHNYITGATMTQNTNFEKQPDSNNPFKASFEQHSSSNSARLGVDQEDSNGAIPSANNENVCQAESGDILKAEGSENCGGYSTIEWPNEACFAMTSEGRGRSLSRETGDYMNKGEQEPSPRHIETTTNCFRPRHQEAPSDYFSDRPDDHTNSSSKEKQTSSNSTEPHGTGQTCNIGADESSARAEPGVSRQDFSDGKS